MVNITTVKQSNARYANEQHAGLVCVFVGATSGIGASTLEKMVQMLPKCTFYVLGRSEARLASLCTRLERLNPSCTALPVQAEVALISNIDVACKHIMAAERKVDYLYMSAGFVPLNGAEYTKEAVEMCFAVSYYTRIRLVCNLLPLLHQSERPWVLSVLNGGREKALYDLDIGLVEEWSALSVINHTTTMTSVSFERLAASEPKVTLMHVYPGLVRTDIFNRLTQPDSSRIIWRIALAAIRGIVGVLMLLIGTSAEDCGERQAFHLTSDKFGQGAWRINDSSEEVTTPGVMEKYRSGTWPERIWDHTMRTFDKALSCE